MHPHDTSMKLCKAKIKTYFVLVILILKNWCYGVFFSPQYFFIKLVRKQEILLNNAQNANLWKSDGNFLKMLRMNDENPLRFFWPKSTEQ